MGRGLAGDVLGVGDQVAQDGVLGVDLGERLVGGLEPGRSCEDRAVEVGAAALEPLPELDQDELEPLADGLGEAVEEVVEARRDDRLRVRDHRVAERLGGVAGLERDVAVAGDVLLADRRGRVGARRIGARVERHVDEDLAVVGDLDLADAPGDRAVDADVHPGSSG